MYIIIKYLLIPKLYRQCVKLSDKNCAFARFILNNIYYYTIMELTQCYTLGF